MSTPTRRRLMRDFKRLQSDPPGGISGAPCSDNIMLWNAVIFGPGEDAKQRNEPPSATLRYTHQLHSFICVSLSPLFFFIGHGRS